MDFALLSTLLPSVAQGISRVLVSYDIGCQWDKKLQARISQYSTSATFELSSLNYWRVVVPKFHLSGHGQGCQLGYNINFTKGAARMCGEGIESGWSQSGNLAIWTRENGPNARRAILDSHWGECNWQKLLGLHTSLPDLDSHVLTSCEGTFLLKNLRRSLAWGSSQREAATSLSQKYLQGTIDEWTEMRNKFDEDPKSPNPYKEPKSCTIFAHFPCLTTDANLCGFRCYNESTQA